MTTLTKHSKLKSGTWVTLHQARMDGAITGRREPGGAGQPFSKRQENIIINYIPPGSRALYMSTVEDGFNTALRAKGRGPYGYTPNQVFYHFILWEGRPVWVSSNEAVLEEVKDDAPAG